MKLALVVYATREGHTRRIAERIVARLATHGVSSDLLDAAHLPCEPEIDTYSAVIVCASVHRGHHESEIVRFVRHHKAELEQLPSAFLSVSLSEATVEKELATPAQRQEAAADVERMIHDFQVETNWHPQRVKAVAGALLYTQYNFVLRFIMKKIASKAGGDIDTSRDHEYTDWEALDRFSDQLADPMSDFWQLERAATGTI